MKKFIHLYFCLVLSIPIMQAESVRSLHQRLSVKRSDLEQEIIKLGNHIVAEFLGCINLDTYDQLEMVLRQAAEAANATVIDISTHRFSPMGMSGLVLLAESHISIHIWPEFGYAAIDTFTCGEHVDIDAAIESLKAFFQPRTVRQVTIERGYDQSVD